MHILGLSSRTINRLAHKVKNKNYFSGKSKVSERTTGTPPLTLNQSIINGETVDRGGQPKGPVNLIQWVKIPHLFSQSVPLYIILSLPM